MPQEPIDSAPRESLPETSAAKNQLRIRENCKGIFSAFKRSHAIPTRGRTARRQDAQRPVVLSETASAVEPETVEDALTLADLKRQTQPAKKAPVVEDDDGGFDPRSMAPPSRSANGASLAAGALRNMKIRKPS